MKHELRCSVCDAVAAMFATSEGAAVYLGVLGKHLRTTRVAELDAVIATNDLAAIERFMKDGGWVEVKADGVTPAWTISDGPIFGFDAYCPTCDRIYCKDHMTTRGTMHAGYGECVVATCPAGHARNVYDDPR